MSTFRSASNHAVVWAHGAAAPLSMAERMALHQVATQRRLTATAEVTQALMDRGLIAERGDHHVATLAGFRALEAAATPPRAPAPARRSQPFEFDAA